nr:hypothetical protein [Tanacetum cinerariifolium]
TACLPNDAIFEGLARMGAKTTDWNEFSSTMASAIIYLANNEKFNFSKYILENMVKNLEAGVNFYMFPRFVQVFVNHQLGVGDITTDTQDIPILTQPSSSQPQRKHKPRRKQRKATKVINLEKAKTAQAKEIADLKKRVKKLVRKKKSRTLGLKRLYKVRLSARVESSEEEEGRIEDRDLFGVHDLDGDEVFVDVTISENVDQDATVAESVEEPEKHLKKKDQITLDKEVARKLEAEMKAEIEEEERIEMEKNEANRAVIEEWDDVHATINADR